MRRIGIRWRLFRGQVRGSSGRVIVSKACGADCGAYVYVFVCVLRALLQPIARRLVRVYSCRVRAGVCVELQGCRVEGERDGRVMAAWPLRLRAPVSPRGQSLRPCLS